MHYGSGFSYEVGPDTMEDKNPLSVDKTRFVGNCLSRSFVADVLELDVSVERRAIPTVQHQTITEIVFDFALRFRHAQYVH